jgi:phospholipid/cholesterol/gamma-HCH transport system substrate-binding protein
MEAESKYTYVGLALVVLVAALVAGVIWLNRTGTRGDFNYYTIYFERQPLDGLQLGADVDMRGIKIGRVEDYQLQPENINRVKVNVRTDRRAPVRTNTVAIVTRNFVTGIAKVDLITPEPLGPPLTEIRADQQFPVIPEGESNLDALAGKVNQLGDMAAETLESLNDVLKPRNRVAFTETLDNLRKLTAGLNARLTEVDKTLTSLNAAMADIGAAGNRISRAVENAGNDLGPTIRQTETTLKDISAAAISLEKQVASLSRDFGSAANTTEDQLTAAVIELRRTVDSMNRVLDRLQDPRAALLGATQKQRGPGE